MKTAIGPPTNRWTHDTVLREARARMRKAVNDNNARISEMLHLLLIEAGWEESDFLKALVQDVAANGRERWMVPGPDLARLAPEGPRRTKSGTMPRVDAHGLAKAQPHVTGRKTG